MSKRQGKCEFSPLKNIFTPLLKPRYERIITEVDDFGEVSTNVLLLPFKVWHRDGSPYPE